MKICLAFLLCFLSSIAEAQPLCDVFTVASELEQKMQGYLAETWVPQSGFMGNLAVTEQAVALNPDSAIAWMARAKALASHHVPLEASGAVHTALTLDSSSSTLLAQGAHYLIKVGLLDAAQSVIDHGLNQFSDEPSLLVQKFSLATKRGSTAESLEIAKRIPQAARTEVVYVRWAFTLRSLGYTAEAIQVAQEGLLRWPEQTELLLHLGASLHQEARYQEGNVVLEERLSIRNRERSPSYWRWTKRELEQDIEATLFLFRSYIRASNKTKVLKLLKNEIRFYPGHFALQLSLQKALISLNNLEAAGEIADQVLAQRADCSFSLITKARQSLAQNRPLDVLSYLDRLNPNFVYPRDEHLIRVLRAESLNRLGRFPDALATIGEQDTPEDSWLKAMAYYGIGDDFKTIETLRQLLMKNESVLLPFAAILRLTNFKVPKDLRDQWARLTDPQRSELMELSQELKSKESPMKRAWQIKRN